jgi:hypothetical protein
MHKGSSNIQAIIINKTSSQIRFNNVVNILALIDFVGWYAAC